MIQRRVLVTGASGFLGRHVIEALGRAETVTSIRALLHHSAPPPLPAGTETVNADLADPASLGGLCEGIDAVVHAAVWIGDNAAVCERINTRGTVALLAEAARAEVRRFVYLSNAAVYGWAVHDGASESETRPAPVTPVSRSRALAERAVLGAGGAVLRPLFVYGEGDTRFLPAVMRAQLRFPFLIDSGRARLSVVSASELGAAATALALAAPSPETSGVFHVSEAEPQRYAAIVSELARHFGFPMPRFSLPYAIARWIVRVAPRGVLNTPRWNASAAHRLFLVSRNHFYDASRLAALLGPAPGPGFRERLPDLISWYRQFLDEPDRGSDAA